MIKKWRECLDANGKYGALMMDLSKCFCLYHDLLIVKLHAHRFDNNALKFFSAILIKKI